MEKFLVALLVTSAICQVMTAPAPYSQLEDYLYQFGYLPATDRENGVKRSETDLEQATMRLQKFMGLEITGKLDEPTLELIEKPRCGRPDMIVRDDDILGVVQVDDGPSNYTVYGKWNKNPVTYGVINRTPDFPESLVNSEIEYSLYLWDNACALRITAAGDTNSADIKISFAAKTHGPCQTSFDGPGRVLAHARYPGSGDGGDAHFDEDETWTCYHHWGCPKNSGTDLRTVAIHEFGHSLGIGHSEDRYAIMYPTYFYRPNPQLGTDDVNAIRRLYGS